MHEDNARRAVMMMMIGDVAAAARLDWRVACSLSANVLAITAASRRPAGRPGSSIFLLGGAAWRRSVVDRAMLHLRGSSGRLLPGWSGHTHTRTHARSLIYASSSSTSCEAAMRWLLGALLPCCLCDVRAFFSLRVSGRAWERVGARKK